MPSVAFATYQRSPLLTDDARLAADVLRRRGVDVHPAVWDAPNVDWSRFDCDEVVIKPAISASARGTWRSSLAAANADHERFTEQAHAQDLLVQPYCPEIAACGEWSMVFFDGTNSHAALKTPADGDFRVQRHFGGQSAAVVPSARLVEDAAAILPKIGAPLLYARVDGIERDGGFVLMELELNEPYLFLSCSDDAAIRFADAIVRVWERRAHRPRWRRHDGAQASWL